MLYIPVIDVNLEKSEAIFQREDGSILTLPVTGGHCKMQWKPDMGMRWAALGVDFEMYGKDHLASARLYSGICRILGQQPPEQYCFELFLDNLGQKISKSKGNGLSLEEWLNFGTRQSLSLFMFNNPKKAKRLYFDSIPKASDEYITHYNNYLSYSSDEYEKKLKNPAYYIDGGNNAKIALSFSMLLNLASACNPENKDILWGFIKKYDETATPKSQPLLDEMCGKAVKYYESFIKPHKNFRVANSQEQKALNLLKDKLQQGLEQTAEEFQQLVYDIAREVEFANAKEFFAAIYEILLGQTQGPRIGSFIAVFGKEKMVKLIEEKVA